MRRKWLVTKRRSYGKTDVALDCTIKMKFIYIQSRLKGRGSPELGLKMMRKKERKKDCRLQFFKQLVQAHRILFMNVLGLDR